MSSLSWDAICLGDFIVGPTTGPTTGGGGSGLCAIVTHHGPTTAGGWGVRTIVKHRGPMTGGRTCDRRGCLKKEDKYASGLMLRWTPDRALKNRTVRPEAGRMAALSVHCAKFAVSMQVATHWCSRGISRDFIVPLARRT